MKAPRPMLALAVLLSTVTLAVGCGGGPDARALFDDALSGSRPAGSGRLLLSLDAVDAEALGLPPRLLVSLRGPFRASGEAPGGYDMALLVATREGKLRLRVIRFGGRSWLVVGENAYDLPSGTLRKLGGSTGAGALSASSFGLDPAAWLGSPRADGETEIDGEKVVRIRATPDVPAVLSEIDRLLGRADATAAGKVTDLPRVDRGAASVTGADAVLLVGEGDRRLRRLQVDLRLEGNGRVRFAYGVSQPGRQQFIGPPASPRPFSELSTALRVLAQRRAQGTGR